MITLWKIAIDIIIQLNFLIFEQAKLFSVNNSSVVEGTVYVHIISADVDEIKYFLQAKQYY